MFCEMSFRELLNSEHFNYFTMGAAMGDEQSAIDAALDLGLIPSQAPSCSQCFESMVRETRTDNKLGKFIVLHTVHRLVHIKYFKNGIVEEKNYIMCYFSFTGFRWRCYRRVCRSVSRIISPLENTFFEGLKLPVLTVFRLLGCWYFNSTVTGAGIHANVGSSTAVNFYSNCRQLFFVVYSHDEKIGDPDEYDEAHLERLCTRKYRSMKGPRRLLGPGFLRLLEHVRRVYPGHGIEPIRPTNCSCPDC